MVSFYTEAQDGLMKRSFPLPFSMWHTSKFSPFTDGDEVIGLRARKIDNISLCLC